MAFQIRIHYDNANGFAQPHLWQWADGSTASADVAPTGHDGFGVIFDVQTADRSSVSSSRTVQARVDVGRAAGSIASTAGSRLTARRSYPTRSGTTGSNAFVYHVEPRAPQTETAEAASGASISSVDYIMPDTGGLSALGANLTTDGRTVFGLYQPNAARVYLMGTSTTGSAPAPTTRTRSIHRGAALPRLFRFAEHLARRHRQGAPGRRVQVRRLSAACPATRRGDFSSTSSIHTRAALSPDFRFNNPIVIDPTRFAVDRSGGWQTPDPAS